MCWRPPSTPRPVTLFPSTTRFRSLLPVMPAREITAIVNTGDDFRHLGLHISPDIDTLLYTLSGKANRAQGWGREGESWNFMDALRSLGGEDWFADRKSTRLNSSH